MAQSIATTTLTRDPVKAFAPFLQASSTSRQRELDQCSSGSPSESFHAEAALNGRPAINHDILARYKSGV